MQTALVEMNSESIYDMLWYVQRGIIKIIEPMKMKKVKLPASKRVGLVRLPMSFITP
jgi:hypothetical protein